jgi:hypothetical protein
MSHKMSTYELHEDIYDIEDVDVYTEDAYATILFDEYDLKQRNSGVWRVVFQLDYVVVVSKLDNRIIDVDGIYMASQKDIAAIEQSLGIKIDASDWD